MKNVILFFAIVLSFSVSAQSNLMSNTTVNTCSGNFESSGGFASGGATASGYSFNENLTMTFCPGTGGSVVAMSFMTFVLGTGDFLSVYNGATSAAPLIGVYDATNPLIGTMSASLATNPGGCLTFVFISDSVGVGNGWNATISCNFPCQAFEIGTDSLNPDTTLGGYVDVCGGDTAYLSVTGLFYNNNFNYPQSDSSTSFYWYLDTTLLDSGTNFSYSPDSSGAYLIQVFAIDTLGCLANFNLNYWVRVGTEPDFTPFAIAGDSICPGETMAINYGAFSVPWTNADTMVSAPTTFLPDGTGSSPGVYNNTLTFSKFGAGDTLASLADLTKFWVDMEHSFLGDLSITMTCPNGSSTILKNFPGGGGRWLGEACDNNNTPTPGIGYVYEWKPTANTLTNMVGHSGACVGCPTVQNPCNTAQSSTTLQSDSYNSFNTMTNMVGCPLNGTWTLTIVDQWGTDNGFLFSWGVEFDSSMYPSTVISYDPGIDSIWLDTALFATTSFMSNDSLLVLPLLDSTSYCYTLNVLDGFGCTHDTTLCFFVRDMCDPACYTPTGPSWVVNKVSCPGGTDGSLIATPDPTQTPLPWTYIWTDNSGNVMQTTVGSTLPDSVGGLYQNTYHLEIIDGNGCSSTWSKYVGTVQSMQIAVIAISETSCPGNYCDATATAVVFYGTTPYSFAWSSGDTNAMAASLCSGSNNLIITDAKGCIDTTNFNVTTPDSVVASTAGAALICISNSTNVTGSASGGTPPYSYLWSNGAGATQTVSVSPIVDQTFQVVVTDANNCPSDSAEVTIAVRPPLTITFDSPDTLCPGDSVYLEAWGHGGDSTFFYAWEQGLGNQSIVQTMVTTSQFYSVTVTDGCGTIAAVDSVYVQVGGYPQIQVTTTQSDTICLGDQFNLFAVATGGDGNYTYEWDNNLGFGQYKLVLPTGPMSYTVTVVDECFTPAGVATIDLAVGNFEDFDAWVDTNVNCDPGTFFFGFDTINSRFTYEFNFGTGFEIVDPFLDIERVFTADGCHDIKVKLTSQYGCLTEKNYPCLFTVLPSPIARFDFQSHNPDYIEHYVDFWDKSIGVNAWSWYSTDTLLSEKPQFSFAFPDIGLHNIKLVVSNEFDCLDSTNTDLPVKMKTTHFFPSAFTPDGNATNDSFKIVGEGIMDEDFDLQVFDRWGGLVFSSSSKDYGWNGQFQNVGDPLMPGLYMFSVTFKLHDGRKVTEKGSVNLLR